MQNNLAHFLEDHRVCILPSSLEYCPALALASFLYYDLIAYASKALVLSCFIIG